MKVDLYDNKGNKTDKKIDLNKSIFESEVNSNLLSQYTYIYNSNQRENIAHTKDRGAVSGGGRKPWKQKGTGNARVGSNRSPIWRKGGITFGPTNALNWKKKLLRKMRSAATKSALSLAASSDKIAVIENLSFPKTGKTKVASQLVDKLGKAKKYTFIVSDENYKDSLDAFSNLKNVRQVRLGEMNAYDIISSQYIIFTESAVAEIK